MKKAERQKLVLEAKKELKEEQREAIKEQIKMKLREIKEAGRIVKRLNKQLDTLIEEDSE